MAVVFSIILALMLVLGLAPGAMAGDPPVQTYYVPFPERDLLTSLQAIESGGPSVAPTNPMTTYISIATEADGTIIYYDQWENADTPADLWDTNYDSGVATGSPSDTYGPGNPDGTQIWGDGNLANGAAPGVTTDAGDVIDKGTVIILNNTFDAGTRTTVANPSGVWFDGMDKIASTENIAVTRTGWASGSNTLLAGSVEVYETSQWGTSYRSPVGTNIPDGTDYQMFEYTSLHIMSKANGTLIYVDLNGDGDYGDTGEINGTTLNEGQSRLVANVRVGTRVISTQPVQVDILTGDIGSNYESRDSALLPTDRWSSNYYTPVSTPANAQGYTSGTTVWLYNPGASAITVTYQRWVSGTLTTSNITVNAGSYAKQVLLSGTGSRFYTTTGAPFYAFSTTDSTNSSYPYDGNQAWDWGFSLVPVTSLTQELLVGLGIGRDPTSGVNPSENANPLWITVADPNNLYSNSTQFTVYIDYDADPTTGPLLDPSGDHYDVAIQLRELEQAKVYDPTAGDPMDQTGMLAYVLTDGVKLAGAWGQDPLAATPGAPGLDVGTSVPPLPLVARLGNYVWFDTDHDGRQDVDEIGVPGVTVHLLYADGTPVLKNGVPWTTVTSSTGTYYFRRLPAGSYMVQFDLPSGFNFTVQNVGDDILDSDADPVTGRSGTTTLVGDGVDETLDAGLWKPTLATIRYFGAAVSNGKVVLEWETDSEVATAGFYVERLDTKTREWVQVNEDLVPSCFDAVDGGSYGLVDSGARPNKTVTYRLVEVEVSGARQYGEPHEVTPTKAKALSSARVASEIGKGKKSARVSHTTLTASKPEPTPTDAVVIEAVAPNRARIEVAGSGLHRIDAAKVATALGLADEQAARDLVATGGVSLTTRGDAVAYMSAVDGSALYFYGQAYADIYTATNVYWLSEGTGTLIRAASNVRAGGKATTTFTDTLHIEQDVSPVTTLFHDPEGDFWLWAIMLAGAGGQSFSVDAPGAVAGVKLTVNLQGYSTLGIANEHHVQVLLNGVKLGESSWTGTVPKQATFAIPAKVLVAGANQVQVVPLKDSGVDYSIVALDSFDLTYNRAMTAVADQLVLKISKTSPVTVNGLTSASSWVLNITNPLRPQLVKPTASGFTGSQAWVTFNATKGASYLVAAEPGTLAPVVAATATADLSAPRDADYVIITNKELAEAAGEWANYRASRGYGTEVVTTASIYDEFNYGIASPHAIQDFISSARANWGARYVLLAGEGSYDYRNLMGKGDCLVPALLVDTGEYGLFLSDVLLADVEGDNGVSEVALGRIPALTPDGLRAALAKIEAYESMEGTASMLLAADGPDTGGNFTADSETIASSLPGDVRVTRAYVSDLGESGARTQLLSAFTSSLVVNYLGHAAPSQLAHGLLQSTDVVNLTGAHLPVLTALTCVVGQYGIPGFDSLSEALVKGVGAGAIAVWSPTALEMNSQSLKLGLHFTESLFESNGEAILGDVIRAAQAGGVSDGVDVTTIRTYVLFGDPALRMAW